MPASGPIDAAGLDPGLVQSAHAARAFALQHCPHAIGGDCTWYHGVWQYLRALGFIKKAGGQGDFLRDMLAAFAADGARRVLISGAADDAMTLIALEAFRDAGVAPELTVVDRCGSPLALSRWSVARAGAAVSTRRADILEFATEVPYDVIVTSGFLQYFETALRPQLFERWASLLRPGGKLLFTNRLRPAAVAPSRFAPREAAAFAAAVRDRAEEHRSTLALDPALLAGWACDYAMRIKTLPVRTMDEILALLDGADFVPERIDTALFAGMAASGALAGPTVADRAELGLVVASRR